MEGPRKLAKNRQRLEINKRWQAVINAQLTNTDVKSISESVPKQRKIPDRSNESHVSSQLKPQLDSNVKKSSLYNNTEDVKVESELNNINYDIIEMGVEYQEKPISGSNTKNVNIASDLNNDNSDKVEIGADYQEKPTSDPLGNFSGNTISALGQINSDPVTFSHYTAPTNEDKWSSYYSNLKQNITNPACLNSVATSAPNPCANYASQCHPQIMQPALRMTDSSGYSPLYNGHLQPHLNDHIQAHYNAQLYNSTAKIMIPNVNGFPQAMVATTLPNVQYFNNVQSASNHFIPHFEYINNPSHAHVMHYGHLPYANQCGTQILPNGVETALTENPQSIISPDINEEEKVTSDVNQNKNIDFDLTRLRKTFFSQTRISSEISGCTQGKTNSELRYNVTPDSNRREPNSLSDSKSLHVTKSPKITTPSPKNDRESAASSKEASKPTHESVSVKSDSYATDHQEKLPLCRPEIIVTSRSKSPNQEINNVRGYIQCEPTYKSFQLLGDSQFVRFAERLNYRISNRRLQYCVSGQTISDLYDQLRHEEFPVHHSVIVLIGSNDMKKRTNLCKLKEMYTKLVELLRCKCEKIILLTIPPIPLFGDEAHWKSLQIFNKFIQTFKNHHDIFVVDLAKSMIVEERKADLNLFEESYGSSGKPDLLHLNSNGFQRLRKVLHTEYFMFI